MVNSHNLSKKKKKQQNQVVKNQLQHLAQNFPNIHQIQETEKRYLTNCKAGVILHQSSKQNCLPIGTEHIEHICGHFYYDKSSGRKRFHLRTSCVKIDCIQVISYQAGV